MIFFQEFQHFCSEIFGQVASKHSDEDEQDNRKTNQKHILQLHFWAALFWQNNHRTAKGRHRPCSGNTADMCGTGIRHRSSNTYCKEKLWKGQQLMPAVSRRRQCLQQTQQKSQSRKHHKTVFPPCTHTYTTATTHPPCCIWKMGTTYCHRRVWRKGTVQLWQCMPCSIHTTIDTSTEQWNCNDEVK